MIAQVTLWRERVAADGRRASIRPMCTKSPFPTQEFPLRTNVDIDDELIAQAMAVTGLPTKKATVVEGLRLLLRIDEQKKAWTELKGMGWQGGLDAMREGRTFDPET